MHKDQVQHCRIAVVMVVHPGEYYKVDAGQWLVLHSGESDPGPNNLSGNKRELQVRIVCILPSCLKLIR